MWWSAGESVSEVDLEGGARRRPGAVLLPLGVGADDGEVDELGGGLFVGEVAAGLDRLADLAVQPLDRVGIPYETARMLPVPPDRLDVWDVRVGEYGATVRDRGIREQTRSGRPVLFGGLRARVSRWPPLRLARMRRERESVGVVCPPVSLHVQRCRR